MSAVPSYNPTEKKPTEYKTFCFFMARRLESRKIILLHIRIVFFPVFV